MENSALLIPSTEVSDEGHYICHISTFPKGIFERHVTLTVWSKRCFLSSLRATSAVNCGESAVFVNVATKI